MRISTRQQALAVAMGHCIKTMRVGRGMTRPQVAELVDITQASVRAWETGRSLPNMHHLVPICAALDVPIWRLVRMAEMRLLAGEVEREREWESVK